jgi:hypothetical protein
MRKLAILALVASCYRTSEWGTTGEYRAHNSKSSEQQVSTQQQATFDERDGVKAVVMLHGLCRPLLLGDHFEQEESSKRELVGTGWMVGTSLGLGAVGAFGILLAAADANNQDVYGNRLPSKFSSTTHTELYISGAALLAVAVAGIIAVVELPSEKRSKRWAPVEGDPKQIVTSEEPVPCTAPPTPVAGVEVSVVAKFQHGAPLAWTTATDASGTAVIDFERVKVLAGWCGFATVTAKVLDQTWTGPIESLRTPLDQIADDQLRALAAACQNH